MRASEPTTTNDEPTENDTGIAAWEERVSHRERRLWVHEETGLRLEALRFGGPVERMETGREPDGAEEWSVSVRPPDKMGDAALETLTDGDRYSRAGAMKAAREWMLEHRDGVPTTYRAETASDYHAPDLREWSA